MTPLWLVPRLNFGKIKVAIVVPSPYKIGIANLGIHTLFRVLNSIPDIFADFFFLDRPKGLRSGITLGDFDTILFSVPFELDYPNIPKILKEAGITVRNRKRTRPFVIIGGIAPSANPVPLKLIADAVVIGEAEATLQEIIQRFDYPKEKFIENLMELDFVYIPELKEEASRAWVANPAQFQSISSFIDPDSVFGNTFLVEIMRGCPNKCRFCLLSYLTLPPRYRPLEPILEMLKSLPPKTPLGLVASAVADHPELIDFLKNLPDSIGAITVSSLRIDKLSEELLMSLKNKGLRTLTIAPEAGTERLRKAINKPISDEAILNGVKLANSIGFERLKLYFMVGLPSENENDVVAISKLIQKVKLNFKGHISVTVSAFVPKPHTPFQDETFADLRELKKKIRKIKVPKDVEINFEVSRDSELQAILSRGDHRIAEALLLAGEEGIKLREAFSELRIDIKRYLESKAYFKVAPYKNIRSGVSNRFLEVELIKFERGIPTPPCNPLSCRACGICS